MDPAGLAVGVVALAGIFKKCLDVLASISAAASFGRDFSLLKTRLDFERILLLHWADRVGLLQQDQRQRQTSFSGSKHRRNSSLAGVGGPSSPFSGWTALGIADSSPLPLRLPLDDLETRNTVTNTLNAVKSLLDDADLLTRKYGLKQIKESRGKSIIPGSWGRRWYDNSSLLLLNSITGPSTENVGARRNEPVADNEERNFSEWRIDRFARDFRALEERIGKLRDPAERKKFLKALGQPHQSSPSSPSSWPQRAKWAISDKEKFGRLVEEIEKFRLQLDALLPERRTSQANKMLEDDINHTESMGSLHLLQSALVTGKAESLVAGVDTQALFERAAEQRIIRCLWFQSINERMHGLADAHSKTFDWVLDPPSEDVSWDSLADWLRRGTGVYWIAGKPGSGKSTLMRYLYNNKTVRALVKEWAASGPLTITGFFFWDLGTDLQKSLVGMMRTLLHDILNENRALIREILGDLWRAVLEPGGGNVVPPSQSEMENALKRLATRDLSTHRYVFFIDGLDEHNGDCREAAAFLKTLSSCAFIKIVASSREDAVIKDEFSKSPSLKLQELTRGDIAAYVKDTVGKHERMQELLAAHANAEEAEQLLSTLTDKASGVFLWVVLACRSLQDGLARYDRLEELRERIDELPPELGSLFAQILRRIDPRYQQQAAKLLHIVYHGRLAIQSEEMIIRLSPFMDTVLADERWDKEKPAPVPAVGLMRMISSDMNKYAAPPKMLSSQELERTFKDLDGYLRGRCYGLIELNINKRRPKHDSGVEFMHRSVFEFINETPGALNSPSLKVDDPNFDVFGVLANIYLCDVTLRTDPGIAVFLSFWYTCACFEKIGERGGDGGRRVKELYDPILKDIERVAKDSPRDNVIISSILREEQIKNFFNKYELKSAFVTISKSDWIKLRKRLLCF